MSDRTEYVLEGSLDDPPKNWSVIYKGNATSTIVRDTSLCAFRVSACRFQSQVFSLFFLVSLLHIEVFC